MMGDRIEEAFEMPDEMSGGQVLEQTPAVPVPDQAPVISTLR